MVNSLRTFAGKEFINIDAEDVDIGATANAGAAATTLSDADAADLVAWLKTALGTSVADIKVCAGARASCRMARRRPHILRWLGMSAAKGRGWAGLQAAGEPPCHGGRPRLAHDAQHAAHA